MAEPENDDSSHYEISLTSGQAFVAFVLLLLSLAAAFAFGVMTGRGQVSERVVTRYEPGAIGEGTVGESGTQIVELGGETATQVTATDFTPPEGTAGGTAGTAPAETATAPETGTDTAPAETATVAPPEPEPATATVPPAPPTATVPPPRPPAAEPVPAPGEQHFAQLLSTTDIRTAETLATRLINGGFPTAYVSRNAASDPPTFRVRVRFRSEAEARAAAPRLRAFSSTDVWIAKE